MREISFILLLAAAPLRAADAPAEKPKIAVVIDDFGLTYPKNVPDEKWMKVPFPYTAAVMPESPRTRQSARQLEDAGKEVIIHFPFDPFLSLDLPAGAAQPRGEVHLHDPGLHARGSRDVAQGASHVHAPPPRTRSGGCSPP